MFIHQKFELCHRFNMFFLHIIWGAHLHSRQKQVSCFSSHVCRPRLHSVPEWTETPQQASHRYSHYMGVSRNGGTPKWMVYKGKSYQNGWFWGIPILGNFHIWIMVKQTVWRTGHQKEQSQLKTVLLPWLCQLMQLHLCWILEMNLNPEGSRCF